MHNAALERMASGDIRDAADNAWCAAKRATGALVLSHTGKIPPKSPDTTRSLMRLAQDHPEMRGLQACYSKRRDTLHGDCIYTGLCEPVDALDRIIHETKDFIQDAETLARAELSPIRHSILNPFIPAAEYRNPSQGWGCLP